MNKTNIIEFIVDEILLKLWNVSSSMRKRLKWMLTDKILVIDKYDSRILKVCDWMRENVEERYSIPANSKDIKKGLANYNINSEDEFSNLLSINGEIKCESMYFLPYNSKTKVNYIRRVSYIDGKDLSSKTFTISKISELDLSDISEKDLICILRKIKYLKTLTLKYFKSGADLTNFKIQTIYFKYCKFKKPLYLPLNLYSADFQSCKGFYLVRFNIIQWLKIDALLTKNFPFELLKNAKGLKMFEIWHITDAVLDCLPSSTRSIVSKYCFEFGTIDLSNLRDKFPLLLYFSVPLDISELESMKLRGSIVNSNKCDQEVTFSPRRIKIEGEHNFFIGYPKFLEKAEDIWIDNEKFEFDCLPDRIKRIRIQNMNIESYRLNRL